MLDPKRLKCFTTNNFHMKISNRELFPNYGSYTLATVNNYCKFSVATAWHKRFTVPWIFQTGNSRIPNVWFGLVFLKLVTNFLPSKKLEKVSLPIFYCPKVKEICVVTNILNLQIFPMYGINSLGSRTHTHRHTLTFQTKTVLWLGLWKQGIFAQITNV